MKQFVLGLLSFFCAASSYSQSLSYLEVWGLPEGCSKNDLVRKLKNTPYGVSQRGLNALGYANAYNFLTPDGQLIILRDFPAYEFIPKIQKEDIEVHEIWQEVLQSDLEGLEGMSGPAFYEVYKEEGIEGLTEAIQGANNNYNRFRLKLDEERTVGLCAMYDFVSQSVSQNEVLKILRHAADPKIRKAAASVSFLYIQSQSDVLKFMPFLYSDQSATIENQLMSYYRRHPSSVDWGKNIDFYCKVLNHPNPFLVTRLLAVMEQTNFRSEWLDKILDKGAVTILEILKSENALELQDKVMLFLNKHCAQSSYGFDKRQWIEHIEQRHQLQARS
ncbi:MAG: hypothetical protein MI784_07640 [Cytophagales bacterium]|nr:hypothetical protein [Cytophagales bacterium]